MYENDSEPLTGKNIFPDAIQVLDYYHLCENVYNYAKYLYPSDKVHMTQWAESTIIKSRLSETML